MTIKEIKEYCIQVDLENVLGGDTSIGAYKKGCEPIQFTCEKDIRLFYYKISLIDLLQTYASYNGLECYRADEPKDYAETYNIDVMSILEYLK